MVTVILTRRNGKVTTHYFPTILASDRFVVKIFCHKPKRKRWYHNVRKAEVLDGEQLLYWAERG